MLRGVAFETCAVVRFKPVERAALLRIQSELLAFLSEESALLRILHHAAGLHFIRPCFDFGRSFRRAVGLQPGADIFIIFRGLNGGIELAAVDAFESEEHVVQWTIVMIFAQLTGDAGAAFIRGAVGDGESCDAFAWAVRGLLGQVTVNDGCVHVFIFWCDRIECYLFMAVMCCKCVSTTGMDLSR